MQIIEAAQRRSATKKFNPEAELTREQVEQLKQLLRLSPSSVNSQPWHFVLAESSEARRRLAKGMQGIFAYNEPKVTAASLSVLFCVRTEIDDAFLLHLRDCEERAGRYLDEQMKEQVHRVRTTFVDLHRSELQDIRHWMEKQLYLNIGTLLLGAAALGIDAVPMEGIDTAALDREFDLPAQGFHAVAVVSFGVRAEDDVNATLPKARLEEEEIFTILR